MEQALSSKTAGEQTHKSAAALSVEPNPLEKPRDANRGIIQLKLAVGAVDDPLEAEADQMADRVMRMPEASFIQRKCAHCGEEEKAQRKPLVPFVQRKAFAENSAVASEAVGSAIESTKGSGSPMPDATRSFMEERFGADFSGVRIHTNESATQLSNQLSAQAFTVGNDVYFNNGKFAPETTEGKHLLAHELTHTSQQGKESGADNGYIQRNGFTPWPGQTGTDVSGTYSASGDTIRERVQRTGDPRFSAPMPSLLEFNTRTCELTSTMEINFLPATQASQRLNQHEFDRLKSQILNIANERLNGWVTIRVSGGAACGLHCDRGNIRVNIVAREGSGPYSSDIELTKTSARENAGHLAESSDLWTIWHEMGHVVLGAPDEYPESPRPEERVNESDWSIMASSDSFNRRAVMQPRHFSHLSAWLGRKFPSCSFELAGGSRSLVLDYSFLVGLGGFSGAGIGSGFDVGLGFQVGIPLDQRRRFRAIVGGYADMILSLDPADRYALFTGVMTGLRYSPNPSSGHLYLGADLRAGAANLDVSHSGDWVPTAGAAAEIGYTIPGFSVGATAGVGTPLAGAERGSRYFNIGLTLTYTH